MLINEGTAVSTSKVILVPYMESHVVPYHEWMKDEEIQIDTASEPLSLEEEYEMQRKWRTDHDKLTFIACLPMSPGEIHDNTQEIISGTHDAPAQMIGDVNLFLSPADEDPEGCIGELELMIAPISKRRRGYGRATILAFLHYIQSHLPDILKEYRKEEAVARMSLLQLMVKIGSRNEKSIRLFESIGFLKVGEGENYFGEIELSLEGFLGEGRTAALMKQLGIEGYRELPYIVPA